MDPPPSHVYDFMITHQPENHPRWEPAVVELRHDAPVRVGTRGRITRRFLGRLMTTPIEFVDVDPGRRARYIVHSSMGDVDVTIDFVEVGSGTEVRYFVAVTLRRGWSLLTPLFRRVFVRVLADINARLVELLRNDASHG